MNEASHSASLKKAKHRGIKLTLGSKESRSLDLMRNPSLFNEGKSSLSPKKAETVAIQETELFEYRIQRTCTKCKKNPVCLDIDSMDLCEPCLYELSQDGDLS